MKVIKWLGHPYVFIALYLLLIIEGDNFGGVYVLYLLLAAPRGMLYAIISVLGILIVVIGQFKMVKWFLLSGIGLMILGLILFFNRGLSNDTFITPVPIVSFCLMGISGICLVFYALAREDNYRVH